MIDGSFDPGVVWPNHLGHKIRLSQTTEQIYVVKRIEILNNDILPYESTELPHEAVLKEEVFYCKDCNVNLDSWLDD